ncbi:hypothetical protein IWQ60_003162 [Tieghemiomyces parasiticus]|uniref:Uncharacterized protein n=1 Tax=Tieghemiomyces parasiticus TaxID=78921 RepID=A0A9W7ZTE0_9FUNG|nr:hypothetical protein IWQ60_009634 [Tieghemiomyces parasiticus]KAJ1927151.1 hypothetical protein IWQ60_003162 [Tieghemiomyces parasiticus]
MADVNPAPISAPAGTPSIAQDVMDSVFQPGVNRGLFIVMNISFIALLATLTFLAIVTQGNIHALILFTTTLALYGCTLWFVRNMPPVAPEGETSDATADTASKKDD